MVQEFCETVQSLSKVFTARRKADTEMGCHAEAVARRHQHSVLSDVPAKLTTIRSRGEPWKRGHAAHRADPLNDICVLGEQSVEQREIASSIRRARS